MKFCREDIDSLIALKKRNIYLEGNIIKLIESDDDDFTQYLAEALSRDKENRKRRLDVTKQIQGQNSELLLQRTENERLMEELRETLDDMAESKSQIECQNSELTQWKEKNEIIGEELKVALHEAERAKDSAESDLDLLQKRTQFELIGTIVRVALYVIIGVGLVTTILYTVALFAGKDTQVIGATWSNMFGILLTNAFSIIGTIMGVKYASEKSKKE
jgi:predicted RNase H-like nuclease (RuvC/YqgF family)